MAKLLSLIAAGATALALNTNAFAEEQSDSSAQGAPQVQQPTPAESQAIRGGHEDGQAGTDGDPRAQGGHPGQHDEYAAALKKCESLGGSQREACIEKAGKDLGDR